MANNTVLNSIGKAFADHQDQRPQGTDLPIVACAGPLSDTRHANPLFLRMLELARCAAATE